MSPRNPAFPIDVTNLQAWEGKSVDDLEMLRDKIMSKMDSIATSSSDNIKTYYRDLLDQLDSKIDLQRTIEDAQTDFSDTRG